MKFSLLSALVVCLVATSSLASEPQPQRFQLALVSIGNPDSILPQVRGLNDGLEESGYVNGGNIVIQDLQDYRVDRVRERLNQVVQVGVDVIVTTSTFATAIAQEITSKIPVVCRPIA